MDDLSYEEIDEMRRAVGLPGTCLRKLGGLLAPDSEAGYFEWTRAGGGVKRKRGGNGSNKPPRVKRVIHCTT